MTPTLRESYAEGDDEELAEVAIGEAALASMRLLAAEPGDSGLPLRRAVLVADALNVDVTPRPDLDDAVVRINGRVALNRVVAAYVDNAAAETGGRRSDRGGGRGGLGDEDAELTVGDAQDHDLAGTRPRNCRSCSNFSERPDTEP